MNGFNWLQAVDNQAPLTIIAGPCVVESREVLMEIASALAETALKQEIHVVFKASVDKANRSSSKGFRGIGLEEGLRLLEEVRLKFEMPVITDVHTAEMVPMVADVVDVLQVPAFLCRQTDLLQACGQSSKRVMIKKGQFMAPEDMQHALNKVLEADVAGKKVWLCERGTSFGYHNLVVDFRGIEKMKQTAMPIVMDATHAVQVPGGLGYRSSAKREFVPLLARAALTLKIAALFMETHPRPSEALSDGASAVPLNVVPRMISELKRLDTFIKSGDFTLALTSEVE